MRYIKPVYYDEFKCIADKCPDTCCAGWQIMIDDETLEKYAAKSGVFEKRLSEGIDWTESCFKQCGSRCSMLNENNLCDLIIALGEDALCETCSRYPRHVEEYEGLREWSISLSCPPAAKMILENKTPFSFLEEEDQEPDPLEDEFEDFDYMLFTQLEDARRVIFEVLADSECSAEAGMQMVLDLSSQMQACLEEERLYDMERVVTDYKDNCSVYLQELLSLNQDDRSRYDWLQKHFPVFYEMERLRDSWGDIIGDAARILFADYAQYCEIRQQFVAEYLNIGERLEEWERFRKNILVFFIYTYFCGAVYDDWIDTKAALAVFSVRFICEFVMCRWYLADKYINWQDCIEIAYRFAREVEHSDVNLNLLEEWLKGTEN